ncbi:MAG: ATP-grasp domain-containing protein [Bacteroidota bacterium]|nr:ATP-grasp domain-containing protein [Bacteroidota bacterium]
MNIGLTYDLRSDYLKEGFSEEETAEFDRESTIEAIEKTLRELGHKTDRIGHARALVKRLARGDRWDLVFNICEGMYGIGREALVPALLEAYQIPYTFSDSMVLALTLHKGMAKRVIRDCGIPTPDFALVTTESDIRKINIPYPLFVKPVAEGTGKGIDARSKINNPQELEEVCKTLLPRFSLGLIVESFLPGREFTVGITGTGEKAESIGVMEVILNQKAEGDSYTYTNKEQCEKFVSYEISSGEIAEKCSKVALDSWRCLNCRDAGRVDIRLDPTGQPHFLEVNPLAGLHPEHSDLPIICNLQHIPYTELMSRIIESAKTRICHEK